MSNEDFRFPPPEALEMEAAGEDPEVPLRDYYTAMSQLREKGFSYQKIADWMTKRLGVEITRGRVAYVLNTPLEVQQLDAEEEEKADEAEERI